MLGKKSNLQWSMVRAGVEVGQDNWSQLMPGVMQYSVGISLGQT